MPYYNLYAVLKKPKILTFLCLFCKYKLNQKSVLRMELAILNVFLWLGKLGPLWFVYIFLSDKLSPGESKRWYPIERSPHFLTTRLSTAKNILIACDVVNFSVKQPSTGCLCSPSDVIFHNKSKDFIRFQFRRDIAIPTVIKYVGLIESSCIGPSPYRAGKFFGIEFVPVLTAALLVFLC